MKNLSLRIRLILSLLGVAICIWSASAVFSWIESRKYIDEFFDTYQLLLARQLSTADWNNIHPYSQEQADEIFDDLSNDGEEEDDSLGFAVFNKNGTLIFHDDENGEYFTYQPNANGFINQKLNKKKEWRIVFVKSADNQFTIAVGQEQKYRTEATIDLIMASFSPWLIGLFFLLCSGFFLVTNAFKPIRRITQNLARRSPNNFEPINMEQAPEEIKPMLKAMNMLFVRIKKLFEQERSFISDSAHELRSPLTALKVQLEVAELSENDPTTQKEALSNLKEGIERASHLVEQLLMLSRLDSQTRTSEQKEEINWSELIESLEKDYLLQLKEKNIHILKSINSTGPITAGEIFLWRILLRNLIDNAIKYNQPNTDIYIETSKQTLTIRNSTSILPENEFNHLGERFYRPAGQTQTGSGLGLSIAKKIAQLHNCSLEISRKENIFQVLIQNNKK